MCVHLHETTSRYDAAGKVLTFVRFCPVCATETVVETLPYEPDFRRGSHSPGSSGPPVHPARMEAA
jgi:hypothetical protein